MRLNRCLFLFVTAACNVVLLCVLSATSLLAQSGKIAGKVVDQQSRDALAGVNVIVEGTSLGAATDADGEYFIINIPPGEYSLSSSMIGYTVQKKVGVLVQTGRTTIVDFSMGTQAVQGEEVTISAEREIVQMDISGSTTYMAGEEFASAPVTTVAEYLQIQEGIQFTATAAGQWLSVRGGDRDETDFMVDGMSTMNAGTDVAFMAVSRTAIKEVSIQTGGFNAEYGRARSGLVNVVTRDGSREEYSLSLDGKYSFPHLKHFGKNIFDTRGALYSSRIGMNNFIPDDKVSTEGNYTIDPATGGFVGGEAWGRDGEVVLNPQSSIYRGYQYDAITDTYKDLTGTAYTETERTMFKMDPVTSLPAVWNWSGWKSHAGNTNSDNIYNNNMYATDLLAEWMIAHPPLQYGNKPDYDMDVTLTGPMPGAGMDNRIGDILSTSTFSLSYRTQTSRLVYPSARSYFRDQTLQAKITSAISPQTKLRLTALYGETNSMSEDQGPTDAGDTGSDLFPNSGTHVRGALSGSRDGQRSGGDLGRPFIDIFNEGSELQSDDYVFLTSARLTHTVSPSTYFEMEYQFNSSIQNQKPIWVNSTNYTGSGSDLAYPQATWIYNKTDAAGNLLMNPLTGDPRTFVTSDPTKIFENGVAQVLDPVTRSMIELDRSGYSAILAQHPELVNARGRAFSTGGEGTWPFSMDLISTWFNDLDDSMKGPGRLDMAQGIDATGNTVAWIDDFSIIPGSFDFNNVMNSFVQPTFQNPQEGGLVYGQTQNGFVLVDGYQQFGGWRQGNHRDRLGEYELLGEGRNINRLRTLTHSGRLMVVSQVTKRNQLKAGVDFRVFDIRAMNNGINGTGSFVTVGGAYIEKAAVMAQEEPPFNRFDVDGKYIFGINQLAENPIDLSAFLQDKIEVQGLIANIGMRLDMMDPTTQALDFNYPYRSEYGRAYVLANPSSVNAGYPDAPHVKAKVQFKWSPRIGLSYPVTETSKVYFNYGWFYQRPRLLEMYQYHTTFTITQYFGAQAPNPNLDWPRTIQMEMGYEQNVKGWFLLHGSGFFKDSDALVTSQLWTPIEPDNSLSSRLNKGYSDVRGLEMRIEKNYGLLRSRLNYTYQIQSRGTAGVTRTFEDRTRDFANIEAVIRSLSEVRPVPYPTFRGTIGLFTPRNWGPRAGENMYPFDNVAVNAIFSWRGGGERRIYEGITADRDYYVSNVDVTNTDLRAEKRIALGRRTQLGLYVHVYNLFNQKYLVGPNGNRAVDLAHQEAYLSAFQYDHDSATNRVSKSREDKWGEWEPAHLKESLPLYLDGLLFNDKRDIFYGLSLNFN